MFQNNFESEDPSTLHLSESTASEPSSCRLECNSVLAFITLGFVFLLMGMVELVTNYQELSYRLALRHSSADNSIVSAYNYVSFASSGPIALYLRFQSLTQLAYTNRFDGEDIQRFTESADSCLHFQLNSQTNKQRSINNHSLPPNGLSVPCGRFPSMWIGDSIHLSLANGTPLPIRFSDLTVFNYDVHDINPSLQWASFENALFQNWMEQNVGIDTYKLIGTVSGGFESQVGMHIQLMNDLPGDIGNMELVMSNNKALGGANPSFCFMNFIQSGLMFVFGLLAYLYRKVIRESVKGGSGAGERKIELRTNFQSQLGKNIQF